MTVSFYLVVQIIVRFFFKMGVLKALNQGIIGVFCVTVFGIAAYFLDVPYALLIVTIIGFGYFIALHYPYLIAVSK